MSKIKIEFDGWHCLSREQMNEILVKARGKFSNANFFEGRGLLIEDNNTTEMFKTEVAILSFCLEIINTYRSTIRNWDGYNFSKISKKVLLNFADKKRKLTFEYFKRLVKDSELDDIKIVLAGILHLDPDTVLEILMMTQRMMNNNYKFMNDDELQKSYRMILMEAAGNEKC
jgi:hypothetical protein